MTKIEQLIAELKKECGGREVHIHVEHGRDCHMFGVGDLKVIEVDGNPASVS